MYRRNIPTFINFTFVILPKFTTIKAIIYQVLQTFSKIIIFSKLCFKRGITFFILSSLNIKSFHNFAPFPWKSTYNLTLSLTFHLNQPLFIKIVFFIHKFRIKIKNINFSFNFLLIFILLLQKLRL